MSLNSPTHLRSRPVKLRDKLLTLMKQKDWSVSDLADAAGLSFPTVRSYTAKGSNARLPNVRNLLKLAKALKVKFEELATCDDFTTDDKDGTSDKS